MSLAWALVIVRAAVGLTLAAHGAQKLFGWFGGPGYAKLEQGFRARGYRPAWLWVSLAILGELGGGLSLAFGFLTSLGAAGAIGAMVIAISTHWKNGFFGAKGGFEYPLTLLLMSLAIGVAGPGAYSLDGLFAIALPSAVFAVLAIAALIVDIVGIRMTQTPAGAPSASPSRAA